MAANTRGETDVPAGGSTRGRVDTKDTAWEVKVYAQLRQFSNVSQTGKERALHMVFVKVDQAG